MWISLCVNGYNPGVLLGMQQTVIFCNFLLRSAELPIMRLQYDTADVNHTQTAESVEEEEKI